MLDNKMLMYSIFIAGLLNLLLPQLLLPYATEKEIKPPNGAEALGFKEQLMHMFVHHAQVPLTSTIIVIIIVTISIIVAEKLIHM